MSTGRPAEPRPGPKLKKWGRRAALGAACAIGLAGSPIPSRGQEPPMQNPCAADAALITDGRRLYLSNGCYACHGIDAKGKGGPDLTKTTKTNDEMFARISNGKEGSAMGPFKSHISPDEIRRIIAYLRSLARR